MRHPMSDRVRQIHIKYSLGKEEAREDRDVRDWAANELDRLYGDSCRDACLAADILKLSLDLFDAALAAWDTEWRLQELQKGVQCSKIPG